MIAYWFPPEGNAAVYRPLRLVRHLPDHGWRGRVIASDGRCERYDPALLQQIPDRTEVIRVRGEDLWQRTQRKRAERIEGRLRQATDSRHRETTDATGSESTLRAAARSLVSRAESYWYHPDRQRPWVTPAVDAALKSSAAERPGVVWATGPPWSAFLVAQRVARRLSIPYVIDFRTSWTIVPSPFEAIRPRWAQRMIDVASGRSCGTRRL